MAMNKREQAELEALRQRVATLEAAAPCEAEAPVPITREEIATEREHNEGRLVLGWFLNEYYATNLSSGGGASAMVTLGCSSGVFHSYNHTTEARSQGHGRMFRTKLDALIMGRIHASKLFMQRLGEIDRMIQEERARTSGPST